MIEVRAVSWAEAEDSLRALRYEVFVQEQQVPESDEWDAHDLSAQHFLATDSATGCPVGTARFLTGGKITRMAIRLPYRRQKVGAQVLRAVLQHASDQCLASVYLDAQLSAVGFYEKFGFVAEGESFWDAGIEHVRMSRKIEGLTSEN